jgi:DNA-binding NarL/FixJ family response regulator
VARVFVVASSTTARATLAARCQSAGQQVVGDGRWIDRPGSSAEAIVAVDEDATVVESAASQSARLPLVLVSDSPSAVRRAAASAPDGWAVVPTAASAEDLAAAVSAVVRGFALAPPRALASMRPAPAPDWDDDVPEEHLTPREQEILELVAQGQSNRGIASTLGISEHTVKFHLASIFGKLGASTRTEAVRRGLRRGLIEI